MSSAQLKAKHNFSQYGQGILEVIVTIGIGTIMILALVVLSIRANRSSDFSKASSQASSLAQEGMEVIKNMVKANTANPSNFELQYGLCNGGPSAFFTWDTFWTLNVDDENTSPVCSIASGNATIDPTYGRVAVIHYPGINYPICGTIRTIPTWELHITTGDGQIGSCDQVVTAGSNNFQRTIYIADTGVLASPEGKSHCNDSLGTDYSKIKQFTVDVSWTDTSGTHHQTQTECIHKS